MDVGADGVTGLPRRSGAVVWSVAFVPCLLLFLATAHWYGWWSADTTAAHWGGWAIAHGFGNNMKGVPGLPPNDFINPIGDRLVVDRTAGVVLASVPVQLVLWPFGASPDVAGVLTATLLSAAAVANLAVLLVRLTGRFNEALAATFVLALGTPIWTVSSAELWTHSVDVFWLSCLLLALSGRRWGLVAVTTVPLVWARAHLVVVFAVLLVAVWLWREERRMRHVAILAAGMAFAVGSLVLWNLWMFDSPPGAYEGQFHVATQVPGTDAVSAWVRNGLGMLFSPARGVFVYTPLLVLLVVALVRKWGAVPDWARAALFGGLAYQAVQLRLDSYVGGAAFFGNRLALETMVLGVPAAYLAYRALAGGAPRVRFAARVLAGVSITVFGTGALLAGTAPVLEIPEHPWREWMLLRVVEAAGAKGVLTLIGVGVVAFTLTLTQWSDLFGRLGLVSSDVDRSRETLPHGPATAGDTGS